MSWLKIPKSIQAKKKTKIPTHVTDKKGENQSSLSQSSPQRLSANRAGVSLEDGGKEHNSKTL